MSDISSNFSEDTFATSTDSELFIREQILVGCYLFFTQISGLFKKKFLHSIRDWRYFLSTFILPCLVLVFSMFLSTMKPSNELKPVLLTPSVYGPEYYSFLK